MAGMSPAERRRWLCSTSPQDHPWRSQEAIAEELAKEAEQDRLTLALATRVDRLPVIEVEHVDKEGWYLVVDGRQVGRFEQYDQAAACAAAWTQDEIAKLGGKLTEPPPMIEPHQAESPIEKYERLLREISELKYPPSERSPELCEKIERTIQQKVQTFRQEHEMREKSKAFEQSLWQDVQRRHPDLSPERREHYRARIEEMVADHKAALARHQHDAPQARNQQQEQGRGIER
jgi:hypothetical protein